jgi:hypothetical protein
MLLKDSHNVFRKSGMCNFMLHSELFVLHLPDSNIMITRDRNEVNAIRKADLENNDKRTFEGAQVMPMYCSPRSVALDFIHTDFIARLLVTREPHYLNPCVDACNDLCRIALATLIQVLVGKDCGSIVGEYLGGKGWPGQPMGFAIHEAIYMDICALERWRDRSHCYCVRCR